LNALQADVHAALRAEALTRAQGPNVAEARRLVELFRELAAHPKRDESRIVRELGMKLRSRLREVAGHIERRTKSADRVVKKTATPPTVATPASPVLAQQVPAGAGPAQGGPLAVAQPAAQPVAGQILDYGPELVALIQATISPDTWDINGGLSSIVYYAPLRVLVISAPQSVHGDIGGVIGQLRR
jgi:hypothetical protein